jgi:hypothetical protein
MRWPAPADAGPKDREIAERFHRDLSFRVASQLVVDIVTISSTPVTRISMIRFTTLLIA